MLGVIREGKGYKPVAICDQCHQVIGDAKQGTYLWEIDQQAEPTGRVAFTHKQCNRAYETTNPPIGHWMWDQLQFYPLMLAANLQVDWKKATADIKLFHSIGV
jgi:hypothetical protein